MMEEQTDMYNQDDGWVACSPDTVDMNAEALAGLARLTGFFNPFLLLLVSLFVATESAAMNASNESRSGAFRPVQSTAEAKTQLAGWIIPGSPISDSVRNLASQGFTCQTTMPLSPDAQLSVVCSYLIPPPPPPQQRLVTPITPVTWIVPLNSKDGTTTGDFKVVRSPKGIGE
ncbi:hypothetical protein [Brucella pituitosa]|uniref:hypothetical protein n=1 Tax=Brucella pituitosa TaxID=571256 RepID=UPI003F4AA55D